MKCPACGSESPDSAKFCIECGSPFAPTCSSCGTECPPQAKFCPECGQALAAASSPPITAPEPASYTPKHLADKILASRAAMEGERKHVTVLFADLQGSMDLQEQVDLEEWHAIMDGFFQVLTEGVHRFEGTVNQYTGDGIMALFGAPIAHEDHAQRACYAALHIREGLADYADDLRRNKGLNFLVRMGINSGDVVVGVIGDDLRMDYTAQGHTVGLASRMESLADSGEINLTDDSARLVAPYFNLADLGPHNVKGVSEPMHVWRLVSPGQVQTRLEASEAIGFSAFVGREREMRILEEAWERAKDGEGGVVGIVAEAGLGKSRLCHEFAERCRKDMSRDARVILGVSHGRATPMLPLIKYLREFFNIRPDDSLDIARRKISPNAEHFRHVKAIDDDDAAFARDLLGFPDPDAPRPPMTPEVQTRRLLELMRKASVRRATSEPGLFVCEDLHWFDSMTEAWLAGYLTIARETGTLIVATFRPEYHAAWMESSSYQQIALDPLRATAADSFLLGLLGSDASLNGLPRLIHEQSGGNPFFAEEAVQALAENGALAGERGAYVLTQDIETLEVPASVQSVLAARIDRLTEAEKMVLQNAAVIGRRSSESLLLETTDLREDTLKAAIEGLLRAELLYETAIFPEREFSFKHALTQDVAYDSQLRERRKAVHARVAEQLSSLHDGNLGEHAALIAHHHEEAGQRFDAAEFHAHAARWIGVRDPAEAAGHWLAVVELLGDEAEAPAHRELFLDASIQIINSVWRTELGDVDLKQVFSRAWAVSENGIAPERRFQLLERYATFTLLRGDTDVANPLIDETLQVADTLGPEQKVIARINPILKYSNSGNRPRAAEYAREAVELAAGDDTIGRGPLGYYPVLFARMVIGDCLSWSGRPQEAIAELESVMARADELGDSEVACWTRSYYACALAVLGRDHAAKATLEEAEAFAQDSGSSAGLRWTAHSRGWMHLLLMEWDEAIAACQRLIEWDRRYTLFGFAPSARVGLTLALLCDGRTTEARAALASYVELKDKPRSGGWHNLSKLADALLRYREGESAAPVGALIDEADDGLGRFGVGLGEIAADVARAYVAARERQSDDAERLLESALARLRGMGAHDKADRVRTAFGALVERVA